MLYQITYDEAGRPRSPAISPDHDRIAYLIDYGETARLYVSNADGSDRHVLTSCHCARVRWASDSRSLIAADQRGLISIGLKGATRRLILVPGNDLGWLTDFALSPDGTRVAFIAYGYYSADLRNSRPPGSATSIWMAKLPVSGQLVQRVRFRIRGRYRIGVYYGRGLQRLTPQPSSLNVGYSGIDWSEATNRLGFIQSTQLRDWFIQ
jgi:Tol biopolymer transport system component